ncbi:MAG: hypothetical protein Greene041619_79 [Candidatus Peregrinibacteria bacterium Greene0416_19]|nr:MAG: hypothetical protein Greene041619_79 [Candidatus Peregrinibacteria bacterium Greene0416_19]
MRRAALSPRVIFPALNSVILLYWIADYDMPSRVPLAFFVVLMGLSLATLFLTGRVGRFAELAGNAQVSLCSMLLLLLGIEAVHAVAPGMFPRQLRDYWLETNIAAMRGRTVEFLEESPYVKFKANTLVRSQGDRGNSSQFCYEWHTDALGFKNAPDLLSSGGVEVVALGDSFTEGMGVCTPDTWPAQLTRKGFPTYNLGVQGYAPTQMEGAFVRYGARMKSRAVVIGYTGTTYSREAAFFDITQAKKYHRFTGGIQSSLEAEGLEVRGQTKHLIPALYLLSKVTLRAVVRQERSRQQNAQHTGVRFGPFARYSSEILRVGNDEHMLSQIESGSPEWQSTLARFSSIAQQAKGAGTNVFLVYLPHRGEVYFSKATGEPLPENFFEKKEMKLLAQFAEWQGMHFINPFDKLVRYVQSISETTPPHEYPYLEIDAHMSPVGYEIVADEVAKALRTMQSEKGAAQ